MLCAGRGFCRAKVLVHSGPALLRQEEADVGMSASPTGKRLSDMEETAF